MKNCTAGVPRNRDDGFSLTEVVLVVAVLAVVSSISVPFVTSSLRGLQVSSDARRIASSLSYAKMAATSKMTRYQLVFDISGNRWSIQRFNRATGNYETEGASTQVSAGLSGSGIALQASATSAPSGFPADSSTFIRFNSRGIPINSTGSPTSTSVIYLAGAGSQFGVTVSLAGQVQVWKVRGGQWVSQ